MQISRLAERHDMCVYYVMCCQPGHFKLLFNWATVLDRQSTFWIQNISGPFPIRFPRSYHYPKTDYIGRVPWSCVMFVSANSIMWQETSSVTVKCEMSQSLNSGHLWSEEIKRLPFQIEVGQLREWCRGGGGGGRASHGVSLWGGRGSEEASMQNEKLPDGALLQRARWGAW